MRLLPCLISALATLLVAVPTPAQVVTGRVTDAESGGVSGAFVALLDPGGNSRAGVLSRADGRFVIRAPAPGRYSLRIERIGYEGVVTPPFEVTKAEVVTRDIRVSSAPIELGRVEVSGHGRCVLRPGEGEAVWRLWSEARKALEVTRWTQAERQLRFTLIRFSRTLDPDSLFVRSESAEVSAAVAGTAYVSDSPLRLPELGFVRGHRRERKYFLPDAKALLSDQFLDSHCFRPTARPTADAPGLVGLAFEPVDADRASEVEGTLWLDAETAQLRSMDVRFLNPDLPGEVDAARYGGRIDFARLADGAWIVSRWRIRMPLFRRTGLLGLGIALHRFDEVEGEVLAVRTAAGEPLPFTRTAAALTGTVREPDTGRPLAGAAVALEGTPYRTTTDASGQFLLEGLPGQRYRVVLDHPALDPRPPPTPVALSRGDTVYLAPGGSP